MEQYPKKLPPQVDSRLRHSILEMPVGIRKASGIVIYGRRIKSLVFTTDLAIIKNCDADAVFAVYPFTPQQSISDAIIKASYVVGAIEVRDAHPLVGLLLSQRQL